MRTDNGMSVRATEMDTNEIRSVADNGKGGGDTKLEKYAGV